MDKSFWRMLTVIFIFGLVGAVVTVCYLFAGSFESTPSSAQVLDELREYAEGTGTNEIYKDAIAALEAQATADAEPAQHAAGIVERITDFVSKYVVYIAGFMAVLFLFAAFRSFVADRIDWIVKQFKALMGIVLSEKTLLAASLLLSGIAFLGGTAQGFLDEGTTDWLTIPVGFLAWWPIYLTGALLFLSSLAFAYYVRNGGKLTHKDGKWSWGPIAPLKKKENEDEDESYGHPELGLMFVSRWFLLFSAPAAVMYQNGVLGALVYLAVLGAGYPLIDALCKFFKKNEFWATISAEGVALQCVFGATFAAIVASILFVPENVLSIFRAPLFLLSGVLSFVLAYGGYYRLREIGQKGASEKISAEIAQKAKQRAPVVFAILAVASIGLFIMGNTRGLDYVFWSSCLALLVVLCVTIDIVMYVLRKKKGLWHDAAEVIGLVVVLAPVCVALAGCFFPQLIGTDWINSAFTAQLLFMLPWIFCLGCVVVLGAALYGRVYLYDQIADRKNKDQRLTHDAGNEQQVGGGDVVLEGTSALTIQASTRIVQTQSSLKGLALLLAGIVYFMSLLAIVTGFGMALTGFPSETIAVGFVGCFFLIGFPIENYFRWEKTQELNSTWHFAVLGIYFLMISALGWMLSNSSDSIQAAASSIFGG
jgi:hypothetical protein